jgi:hypothetical protein
MEIKKIKLNKGNWTGKEMELKYRVLKDGNIKFKFGDIDFEIIFEETDLFEGLGYVHSDDWDCKRFLEIAKFNNDGFWTCFDGDNISREHENPAVAVAQVLCNIL